MAWLEEMAWLEDRQREVERLHVFYEIEDENIRRLAKLIHDEQERIKHGRGRFPSYAFPLFALKAQTLARITVRTLVRYVLFADRDAPPSYIFTVQSIRDNCCWELHVQEREGGDLPDIVGSLAQRNANNHNYEARKKQLESDVAAWRAQDWSVREGGDTLGGLLLELAAVAEIVTIKTEEQDESGDKDIRRVYPGRKFNPPISSQKWQLGAETVEASAHALIDRPMIVPPRPWMHLTGGGFLIASSRACPPEFAELVKHRNHKKRVQVLREAAQHGKLATVFSAVNALQGTPWRLNQRVYTIMRYVWENRMTTFPDISDRGLLQSLREELLSLKSELRSLESSEGTTLGKRKKELEEQRVVAALKAAMVPLRASDILKHYGEDKESRARSYLKWLLPTMVTQGVLIQTPENPKGGYELGPQPKKKVALVGADELERQTRVLNDAWREYYAKHDPLVDKIYKQQRLLSQILRLETLLSVCKELQRDAALVNGALRLYFPYQLDYRGRAYSIVSSLSPQGNDHARALLEFADGEPLGLEGKFWLAVHVANMYGQGKKPYEERFAWTVRETDTIRALAALAPSDTSLGAADPATIRPEILAFWKKAKEPWQFLAACFEWACCESENFQTHLPISLDASSSGYQHLSALARDREGARVTNLLPSDKPQDLYQRVADDLATTITDDLATIITKKVREGDRRSAEAWNGHITRSTVKQAVMTTPYGSTFGGKRRQIVDYLNDLEDNKEMREDRYPLFSSKRANAGYLAKKLKDPTKNVVPGAYEVMEWLKVITIFCARQLGHGVFWTTPANFPVTVEEYKEHKRKKTFTFTVDGKQENREFELSFRDPSLGVDAEEQGSKIVSNFIHSLDAAHMMLTICRLQEEGLRHFAVVHDSYGVHAPHVLTMMTALKEEFVKMYQISPNRPSRLDDFLGDQIELLSDTIEAIKRDIANQSVTGEGIEELVKHKKKLERKLKTLQAFKKEYPSNDQFDIEEILDSKYMFS